MKILLGKAKTFVLRNWPIFLLILVSGIVYRRWLSFEIFSHEDYDFFFSETLRDSLSMSAWNSKLGIGSPNMILWMWIYKSLPGLFAIFGFNSNVADKFLIFWPFVFLTPIFAYLAVKEIIKNKAGAFLGACVYSFNTYYLAINTQGHFSLSLAGTFAPLAILFFWRYFERGNVKNILLSSLAFMVVSGYDFRVAYILFFVFLLIPFWFLFFEDGYPRKKAYFKRHFMPMIIFFGTWFLMNLFWILPTMMTGSLMENDIVSRELVPKNYYLDTGKALTLFHPFWNGSEPEWFDDQDIPFYFWGIPILAILGAYYNRKNRKIILWFFIAILAVFFSKQDASPFEGIYPWFHKNFPGFNAFREASKFYFAIAISYAILIGSFFAYLSERLNRKKILKTLAFGIIFLLFFINTLPIIKGDMKKIFTPKYPRQELEDIRNHILKQGEPFRNIWILSGPIWATYTSFNPKVSFAEMEDSNWDCFMDFSGEQGGESNNDEEKQQTFFSLPTTERLFSQSAIKYVLASENNYYLFEKMVSGDRWKKIELGGKETVLFENLSVRPRIYLTEKMETINRDNAFEKISFEMGNASRWNIFLPQYGGKKWLNFSESYHPSWRLSCGNMKWYEVFSGRKLFSQKDHFRTDAKLNAFRIDLDETKEKCGTSSDGTMRLSLFYVPQAYMYLGGSISVITIISMVLYLFLWKRKNNQK